MGLKRTNISKKNKEKIMINLQRKNKGGKEWKQHAE